MKNIFLKKFIVLFSLVFVIFGFNFVSAEDTPVVDPINIHLEVISGTDTPIYDKDIAVTPCDSEGDGVLKATPYCALVQASVANDYSGLWINSIAQLSNDYSDPAHYKSWTWLANLDFSHFDLSSKQYELQSNDKILFYFDTNPLKISSTNLTPEVGSEITISMTEPDYGPWPPVWVSATLGKLVIGSGVFELDVNGEYKINIINTDPIVIKGQKDGYIDSPSVTINPIASAPEETVCTNSATNPPDCDNNTGSGSSSGSIPKSFSIPSAISFLSVNQKDDGSFGDSLYTDWVAIAASAGNDFSLKSSISNYLLNNQNSSSVITDYERRAMALMALGINPYTGTSTDYIQKITNSFDGTQVGDTNLFNDDIFALIVLQNAGYTNNDVIIKNTISYIISKQSTNGSWGSVDMTSAGIEALNNFKEEEEEGVSDAISKAENYLKSSQNPDGGFYNTSSTSWAIQAMSQDSSLNENVNSAIKYLTDKQQNDGGLDGSDTNNRVWITSYAIPAVLKMPWSDILESFDKPESTSTSQNNKTDVVPVVELQNPIPSVPQAEVVVMDEKVKELPVKIEKKKNIKIKVVEKAPQEGIIAQEVSNTNLLEASAGNFDQNNNKPTFIHKLLKKIASPFVWLWISLGF